MTDLRASNVHPDSIAFREEPPVLFGNYLTMQSLAGTTRATALQSLGQGISIAGFGWAKDQGSSLKDVLSGVDGEQLTPEIYEQMRQDPIMGQVDIPFDPTISVRQFRARLGRQRRETYVQSFDRSILGYGTFFVGAMAGGMASPEVLATLPVGGAALAGVRGMSTGMAMRQSLKAGAQISVAATPLNVAAQELTYGQVDPIEVAAVALAPLAFTPASVAFTRFAGQQIAAVAARGQTTPMPRPVLLGQETDVPSSLRALFDDYNGEAEQWLAAYARRDPDAVAYADRLSLDDAARSRLDDMVMREAGQSPLDVEALQEVQTLIGASQGRITFEDAAFLSNRGLLDEAEALRLASTRPPVARDAVDLVALRGLEQRRAALIQKIPELGDALRWEDFMQARRAGVPGQTAVQNVARSIQNALRKRDPNMVDEDLRPLVRDLIAAEEAPANVRNVAFQREQRTLGLLQRAVDGDETATPRFMERMMALLPEHAQGDARALRQGGLDALRVRYLNRLADDIDAASAKLGAAVEARRGVGGRKPASMRQQQKELRDRIAQLEAEHARVQTAAHREPASISVDELAEILSVSTIERPASPQARYAQADDFAPVTRRPATESDFQDISAEVAAYARKHGVDPADLANTPAGRAQRILEECV